MALYKRIHSVCVCVCVCVCVRPPYSLTDANLHACMTPTLSNIKLFGYRSNSVGATTLAKS
jgi:hypothetical protein